MRLRSKLSFMFIGAFMVNLAILITVFPTLTKSITLVQLRSQALTIGYYLLHNLESLPFDGDEASFEKTVDAQFEFISVLGEKTGDFTVREILLLNQAAKVEIGHPDSEKGLDYSSHADVMEALKGAPLRVVIESNTAKDGTPEMDADIVAPVRLADGDSRVVEIKLNLSATTALLDARFRTIELAIAGSILAVFALLSGLLLMGIGGAVIRPLLRVSKAMEKVGRGELEVKLNLNRNDEIGAMAARFDEMVIGLRERFELSRYVSKSTAGAARSKAVAAASGVTQRRLTMFFSDVRGFTAYSEKTPPEQVIAVLNRLLGLQEKIIADCGGEVDKFVGDEAMAIFEKPSAALQAALKIRRVAKANSAKLDGLRLGIGLHIGPVVEGDIGSPNHMDHTVIGDTVNTAARIQGAAEAWQILVSEDLIHEPGIEESYQFEGSLQISAKGKSQPVPVRALVSER